MKVSNRYFPFNSIFGDIADGWTTQCSPLNQSHIALEYNFTKKTWFSTFVVVEIEI